jgi:hypothetical protein
MTAANTDGITELYDQWTLTIYSHRLSDEPCSSDHSLDLQ